MANQKKYYTVLGLRDGASQIEIKNAYKNLVSIHHPDVNKSPDAHKKMLEINQAYNELFNQILYNKEMDDLKKDPDAYHRARATYPIVFQEEDENNGSSKTHSSTAVKPYTKPKKPVNTTKSTGNVNKKDSSSGLAPFCLGGAVVALIFALLSFPPLLFIGLIAIGAYFLLK